LVNLREVVLFTANHILATPSANGFGTNTVQFASFGLGHARLNGSEYLAAGFRVVSCGHLTELLLAVYYMPLLRLGVQYIGSVTLALGAKARKNGMAIISAFSDVSLVPPFP
jgi:hypothetical protein